MAATWDCRVLTVTGIRAPPAASRRVPAQPWPAGGSLNWTIPAIGVPAPALAWLLAALRAGLLLPPACPPPLPPVQAASAAAVAAAQTASRLAGGSQRTVIGFPLCG